MTDRTDQPFRPSWANEVNPALREIMTLRRVYTDGVKAHRRGQGTREWDRWAGWCAVRNNLAMAIADTVAFRPHATPNPDDVALYRRVIHRTYTAAPKREVSR